MIFKYPLGLLGLLGIPILILIYIIKSKYTEQTISSTYLWRLSEKFLKNKRHKKTISGLISLILQIVAVIALSFIIAHPVITLPGAANEYCFILDASGSMNMRNNDKTRLELGKEKIEAIINESTNGSSYTLISLKEEPEVLLERNKDKEKTIEFLNGIRGTDVSINTRDSLGYAQYYFNQNKGIQTYIVTDKNLNCDDKVKLINVGNNENNYALKNTSLNIVGGIDSLPSLEVRGEAISFESDANLTVELYVDGARQDKVILEAKKNEAKEFIMTSPIIKYSNASVKIINEDGLMSDNEVVFYNIEESHSYSALIISEFPAYLENILNSSSNISLTTIKPEDYDKEVYNGYSLYVFDAFTPAELPSDGAVWLFGIDENIKNSGFTFQKNVEAENYISLELNKSSNSLFKKLTKGLIGTEVAVKKYNVYGLVRSFTILYEYENIPMIFTGTNAYGNREVVFAFDLHDSNFPLQMDYISLSKNLIDYTFPVIMDKASYVCGDKLEVNILSGCDSIRVESPSQRFSYMDTTGEVGEYALTECGTYKIKMRFGEKEKVFEVFVSLPEKESYDTEVESYIVTGEAENGGFDGFYDRLTILFIVLAIIYIADWMVYCYEQYQLR